VRPVGLEGDPVEVEGRRVGTPGRLDRAQARPVGLPRGNVEDDRFGVRVLDRFYHPVVK
jgi:hypothetical protein